MELVKQCDVPADQVEYFVKAGLTVYADIALLATEEKDVIPEIIAPMIASEVASAKTPMGKISVKKLWEACRDRRLESRRGKTDTSILTEAPVPLADDADIVNK